MTMSFLLSGCLQSLHRLHHGPCSAKPAWPHLMTIHYPLTHKAFSALPPIPTLANTPVCTYCLKPAQTNWLPL